MPSVEPNKRLFVSYAREDEAIVEELVVGLERAGVAAFYDRQLKAGVAWRARLREHMEACREVVACVSPAFTASEECRRELVMAQELGRPIMPVVLRACDWASTGLGGLNALPRDAEPLEAAADREDAVESVVDAITAALGHPGLRLRGRSARAFVGHHLRAPFGEQAELLRSLDAWLADPHAPPYGLLTAPAGRGKSTALCWFARRAAATVIFHAVSIRFGPMSEMDYLVSVGRALSRVHGGLSQDFAQQLRAVKSEARRVGAKVTIVLDVVHVMEYVWKAARALFDDDSPKAEPWSVTARWSCSRGRAVARWPARSAAGRPAASSKAPRSRRSRRSVAISPTERALG